MWEKGIEGLVYSIGTLERLEVLLNYADTESNRQQLQAEVHILRGKLSRLLAEMEEPRRDRDALRPHSDRRHTDPVS